MSADRVYFPGLNGIRFIAAYAVIIHHVEQTKYWANLPNVWGRNVVIDALGHRGVSLFFTLSGFLITYLLLAELRKTASVNVYKFYVRRTLRIWPLYYFLTLVTFFVLPHLVALPGISGELHQGFYVKLFLYLILIPNIARQMYPSVLGSNQAWSVGIEEQFYAFWPWLIRWFRSHLLTFLFIFIAVKLAVQLLLMGAVESYPAEWWARYARFANTAWRFLQIEQMAVGAIGAYILFNGYPRVLRVIYHPWAMWGAFALILSSLLVHASFVGFSVAEAAVYTVAMINISTNAACPVKLNSGWLQRMGDISYGIYMYHTICLAVVIRILMNLNLPATIWVGFNAIMYTVPGLLTLAVSWLSYRYFESFFIRLKERFMVVKSATHNGSAEGEVVQPLLPASHVLNTKKR
jgi:peptidoglycan/LPS O-acetylase OafA/YrhL